MDTSNLSSLLDIIRSPDFQRIPLQRAMACEGRDWTQQHAAMLQAGSELAIWQVAAFCALVLATYPGAICSIRPQWSTSQDDGQTHANMEVEVDGNFINNPERIELDEDAEQAVSRIDAGAALRAALEVCDNTVGEPLVLLVDQINAAFSQPIASVEQAHQVMAIHAPFVSACVEQARLERQTAPASRRTAKGGRL